VHAMAIIHSSIEDVFQQIKEHELIGKVSFIKQTTTKLFGSKGMCDHCSLYLFVSNCSFILFTC